MCAMAVDCVSGLCTGGMCFSASCGDGTKNGAETDVDCGGGSCPACAPNKVCAVATDCGSGICKASACIDDHVWSERFGDADVQTATDVAVDGLGNVTLLGNFLGTINLGGATLTNPCVFDPQTGDYCDPADNYLARFDGAGKHIWSKRFVNKGDGVSGYGITSAGASSGDTWILSYAMGSLDFGAGEIFPDPTPCPPGCAVDTTIARLDSTGKYVYGKRYSGVSGSDDIKGAAIAVIPAGDVAITGAFSGGVSFGVGTLTSAGSYDVFVAKLNGDGTQHWAKRFGENTAVQEGRAVALDGAGNVFVAGTFKVSIDLGGGALSSAGGSDLFLAKLDSSNGGYVWAKRFGDVQDQISTGTVKVATDAAGNVFFAGPLQGSVNFGGGVLTATAGKIDMFVAKFDMGGTHLWSKRFGDAQAMASSTFGGLAVDTAGALIFTGTGNGSVDFGGGPLVGGFLVKLDPSGAHVWSKAYGGGAVATDGAKSIVLAGALFGTQDLGGGPLTSAGSSDAFVAKFIDP